MSGGLEGGEPGLVRRADIQASQRDCVEALKELTRPYWASKPNETELRIELITGGTIALVEPTIPILCGETDLISWCSTNTRAC